MVDAKQITQKTGYEVSLKPVPVPSAPNLPSAPSAPLREKVTNRSVQPGPDSLLLKNALPSVCAAKQRDLAPLFNRIHGIMELDDPRLMENALRKLQSDLRDPKSEIIQSAIKDPAAARAMANAMTPALLNGYAQGEAGRPVHNRRVLNIGNENSGRYPRGSGAAHNPGSGKSRKVNSMDELLKESKGPGKAHYEYAVDPAAAARVKQSTGVEIAGMTHRVDADHVRHFNIRHGTGNETHGNQEALTDEDVRKIPSVTHNFDSVEKNQRPSKQGKTVLTYKKRFNGNVIHMVEVRDKKGIVSSVNLRKEKAGMLNAKTSSSTSETSSSKPNIP